MTGIADFITVPSAARVTQRAVSSNRLLALDIMRGYAMLLMLVSHSSWWLDDLDYGVAYGWDNMIVPQVRLPDSLPGLILQLATPAFFLLAGFGVALFSVARRRRGWTEWQITRFLLIRGCVLIALDLTMVNLKFSEPYYSKHLSVLTGMGICVCLLAALRWLRKRELVVVLVAVLMATQLYYSNLTAAGDWPRETSLLRAILLAPSVEDLTWKTQFPALGWLPVVLLGFVSGSHVMSGWVSLGKLALTLGVGCLLLFAAVPMAGHIGNLYPADPLIFGKHPPDLGYITFYTGLTFLIIALHSVMPRINTALPLKVVMVFGQTALFFYIVHIRLIELVSPVFAGIERSAPERSLLIVAVTLPVLLVLCIYYRLMRLKHPGSILQYL